MSPVVFWGGLSLPKAGDGFISSPFDPVIPWRVALQQSPPLFSWTERVCLFEGGEQHQKPGSRIPRQQTKRAIRQMRNSNFARIRIGLSFHAVWVSCRHAQNQPASDSPMRYAAAADCKRFQCTGRGPVGPVPGCQKGGDKAVPI